ncbi:MAG: DUF4129 domain-containing protein [Actinomycetes bacterium]
MSRIFVAGVMPGSIPVDIGRDEARELAERELLDPVYAKAQPPWWQELTSWLFERLREVLDRVGDAAGSGFWVLVLVAVVVVIAFVVMRRTGGLQRSRAQGRELFASEESTAEDHRSLAERAARREDWAEAVRESFRAIVRQLEERGAIDRRPGRTADEAARDAGRIFDTLRVDLGQAARTFDEVVYGERSGTAQEYQAIRGLDRTLASTVQALL